jgi:hypothetical protein
MFVLFVLMLLLAVLTDNSQEMLINKKIAKNQSDIVKQLTTEVVSDHILKNEALQNQKIN